MHRVMHRDRMKMSPQRHDLHQMALTIAMYEMAESV